jgi:biopolymer transport protein TolR
MSRKFHVRPAADPKADINITPLVDIVLVMLIIFMVVTPLLEKDIGVRMPQTEEVRNFDEVPPDQLVVKIEENGDLAINNTKVSNEEYIEKLSAILQRKKKPEDKLVFVVADDGASYGRLVTVLDGAKQAGAEVLGMATEKPSASAEPNAPPAPAPPAPQ